MKRLLLLVAALALLMPLGALGVQAATTQPQDQAPECVTITIAAYRHDGSLARTHLTFCGNGPGKESALMDWVNGRTFQLDGATHIGGSQCGGRSDPCVIFGP